MTVRGREALEKAFAEFFAKTPEVTATMRPEALRFLSRDSGIEEGSVTIRRGPAEPATNAATAPWSYVKTRVGDWRS